MKRNRIDAAFMRLRGEGAAGLVPYITVGDPSMSATREIMEAMADAGADLIELGVPFSDPTSDGPILQRASEIALRGGASLPRTLELVAQFRVRHQLPIVLYGYFNPILRYGPERFARDAKTAGVDGVLVVDLPPEEDAELRRWTAPQGIHFISLLAPTTSQGRTEKILSRASGFVYYVSVTGVTGVKAVDPDSIRPVIENLRALTDVPIGVGFGISTTADARAVAKFADAVVVGSSIMKLIDAARGTSSLVTRVSEFVGDLKSAVAAARSAS